ncbi:hypothetical protein [Streptomyces sp. 769]|uniref:hypothetical protein n=1 Tax=Streptomyces sp. 769 TaxID=1262452 RepID=UPI00057F1599|nr:hypothetical protein [Streptomyces sp. 769]AJC61149.1 hypothetical protein GZL_08623 [Streptomyces sp. 769]
MTKQPTNDAAIQQWNRIPREALEAMEPDGDFAERHLINPVPLHMPVGRTSPASNPPTECSPTHGRSLPDFLIAAERR